MLANLGSVPVSVEIKMASPPFSEKKNSLGKSENEDYAMKRSSLNFPVKSPYGSPRSVKLLIPPTCLAGEARCEAPRLS